MISDPTLRTVKWPQVAAASVRIGAALAEHVDVPMQVSILAKVPLDEWVAGLDTGMRAAFIVNLSELLVALDQADLAPDGVASWPPPSSPERRAVALALLKLPTDLKQELETRNPLLTDLAASPLVWVDPDAIPAHDATYMVRTAGTRWRRYRNHLERRMGWPNADVEKIGEQLDIIVQALADPAAPARSSRRVLVVGHTQSGKTANFLGLAARMADAGVQTIVILSGRTKLLRRQTQARVDRDLVGGEPGNLPVITDDYGPGSTLLTGLASVNPEAPDEGWTRVSRRQYKTKGIGDDDAFTRPAIGLGAVDPTRPVIVVLKKTPGDLREFAKWIGTAPAAARRRPAIVIDEEADEATLNYKQKKNPGGGWAPVASDDERTAINRWVLHILAKLEASTYVGYTATPFANCVADANDSFFPHAIQVLDPPAGYFGAAQVFDSLYEGPATAPLPSKVHTRGIDDPAPYAKLDEALDDYLISGGIRLFRLAHAGLVGNQAALRRLRHHTMMVHVNTRKMDQEGVRDEVQKRLFTKASRGLEALGPADTVKRLKQRYLDEFHTVSDSLLGFPGRLPTAALDRTWLPDWNQLCPYLETAIDRLIALNAAAPVVLLVNSDEDSQTPDYDGNSTPEGLWCVLVGGLMLSRGFTIEGLSTAYFRRKAGAMDTQLQLARWNGYRNYIEDAIRLHFGTKEPGAGKAAPRNLLVEFETSSWRDHEFREQLRRYGQEGTSPRRDLPRLYKSNRSGQLPMTAPGKRRGVVTESGAPMEFGRRGTGLTWAAQALRALEAGLPAMPDYETTPVCPKCDVGTDARTIQMASVSAPEPALSAFISELLRETPAAADLGIGTRDEKVLLESIKKHPWRVAVIGMTSKSKLDLDFDGRPVPVRLRASSSPYDTLSTGDWNDWMRGVAGGECRLCGKRTDAAAESVLVLVPYASADGLPREDAKWGVLAQTIGRAGGSYQVAKPSPKNVATTQP